MGFLALWAVALLGAGRSGHAGQGQLDISHPYRLDCPVLLTKSKKHSAISFGLCDLIPQNSDCFSSLALKQSQARPPEHECTG